MLGAGNDTLTIDSTLQPGGDFNPLTGAREQLAHHGGVTAVHGGGNALLFVDGTFTAAAGPADAVGSVVQLTRDDGLMWTRYGFLVGQQVTLPNGSSYTVTGFKTRQFRRRHAPARRRPGADAGALVGELAVSDYLAVTSTSSTSLLRQRHPAGERAGVAEPRLRGRRVGLRPGHRRPHDHRLRERPVAEPVRRDAARRRDPARRRRGAAEQRR